MLFRLKLSNCVHYPYARTNGASHRRVVVAGIARAACARADGHVLHCNVNSPSLLVTILYSQVIMILLFEKAEIIKCNVMFGKY